jgi:hypothetical protein
MKQAPPIKSSIWLKKFSIEKMEPLLTIGAGNTMGIINPLLFIASSCWYCYKLDIIYTV